MPFYVYQSNRLEKVIPPIASVLAEKRNMQSGFRAQELLSVDYCLVQSIGMGRYFALELASELGIFANYKMVYPNAFMRMLASHLKIDDTADSKESIAWKIFSLIKNSEIENEVLARYIESARIDNKKKYDDLKLFNFAYSLSDLFDQYSLYRPSMVTLWDMGEPVKTVNNVQQPLEKDELWQFELWRKVYDGTMKHKAEIRAKILSRIKSRGDLPFDRFFILGVSTIPLFFLEVIHAVSQYCDVYTALLSPSDSYWEDIVNKRYRFFRILGSDLKKETENKYIDENQKDSGLNNTFDDYFFTGNTILGSNGMLGRDFNRILSDNFEQSIVQNDSYYYTEESNSLLGNIQRDIRELNDRGIFGDNTKKKFVYRQEDCSLQIHGVHSKRRELEVLHDNLLEIMQKNPDIELRDILVMTPSVHDYAPYIKAVFEEFKGTKLYLDYSIADLALDSDNETVPAFLKIISLYKGRFTSGDIISLLRLKPLSGHAQIDDENIEKVAEILNEASFRWGRDSEDRKDLLDIGYEEFSFAHAFKRIIHSTIFVKDFDQTYNGIFPSDDFDRDISILAGRVLDFIIKLENFTRECANPRPVNQWEELLRKMVNDLFSNRNDFSQSRDVLFETITAVCANSNGASDPVSFEIVESLLSTHLSGESRAFGFIDGRITFCEMLPMRSIPFKVIAIIGFNEVSFPRKGKKISYDLLSRYPSIGDRSMRFDDRYLFLETILSAREYLYFSYQSFKESDNSKLFPSPLLLELLHYLEENCDNFEAERFIVSHKLQPFSSGYLDNSNSRHFTYDSRQVERAKIYYGPDKKKYSYISDYLNPADGPDIYTASLRTIIDFFDNPCRFLLTKRAGIEFAVHGNEYINSEDLSLSNSSKRRIIGMLVERLIEGKSIDNYFSILSMNGLLPLFAAGKSEYSNLMQSSQTIYDVLTNLTKVDSFHGCEVTYSGIKNRGKKNETPFDISSDLDFVNEDGRFVIVADGQKHIKYSIARIWLEHLLFQFSENRCKRTFVVSDESTLLFNEINSSDAAEYLSNILDLYSHGLIRPLRFILKDSFELYKAINNKSNKDKSADDLLLKLNKTPYDQTDKVYNDYSAKQKRYRNICFDSGDDLYTKEFYDNTLHFFEGIKECCPGILKV